MCDGKKSEMEKFMLLSDTEEDKAFSVATKVLLFQTKSISIVLESLLLKSEGTALNQAVSLTAYSYHNIIYLNCTCSCNKVFLLNLCSITRTNSQDKTAILSIIPFWLLPMILLTFNNKI